jgi:hypothetical protein
MRITIEPTTNQSRCEFPQYKVSVEVPSDDLHIKEMVRLVRAALLALTYHPNNVDDYVPEPPYNP